MNELYGIVITTVSSEAAAEQLAQLLLAQHLVACVQIEPIRSYYRWQGEIQVNSAKPTRCEHEQRLSIKCRCRDYPIIQSFLQAHHSYENPQIILVRIADGAPAYLAWIDEVTQ